MYWSHFLFCAPLIFANLFCEWFEVRICRFAHRKYAQLGNANKSVSHSTLSEKVLFALSFFDYLRIRFWLAAIAPQSQFPLSAWAQQCANTTFVAANVQLRSAHSQMLSCAQEDFAKFKRSLFANPIFDSCEPLWFAICAQRILSPTALVRCAK